jgi:type I restriction enzyme S subunit
VCIAIVGANVAETGILKFDACFPDSVIGLIVDEALANNEYIEYLLQNYKSKIKEKGKGTARDNINIGTFENEKFPIPNLSVQSELVEKINKVSTELKQLQDNYSQRLVNLEELKKSILHKAFTGELNAATKTLTV